MVDDPQRLPARRPPGRRIARHGIALALATAAAVLIALIAATWTVVSKQAGTDWLVRELVARSRGALEIDGATGTLTDTVRVRRIVWHGSTATVTASDVALTWRPAVFLTRGIVVEGLGARELTLEFSHTDEAARTLPDDLALPLDVTIERLGVAKVVWSLGGRRGTIEGLEFGYHGSARVHAVTALTLTTADGTFKGAATLGAHKPFAVDGHLAFAGEAARKAVRADAAVGGTLSALDVALDGAAGAARAKAHAALAPLDPVPLREVDVDVSELDLAFWDPRLPATKLTVNAKARPEGRGLTGDIEAANALSGKLDSGRTPVRAASARFAWQADAVSFDRLRAELEGGATAAGSARLSLAAEGVGSTLALELRDIDLHALYSPLVATRLGGTIAGDVEATRRTLRGELLERNVAGGIALTFAASYAGRAVDFERLQARAGAALLDARARFGLDGERAFSIDATTARLDPSRFGAFPAGALDGQLALTGTLAPTWTIRGTATLAATSRLAGLAVAGNARGTVARDSVRDAALDARIGSAHIVAAGSYGIAGERMTAAIEAPRLAELAPLLPANVPRPFAGGLDAKGEFRGAWPDAGFDVAVRATALQLGSTTALGTLSARATVAPAGRGDAALASRRVSLDLDATDVTMPAAKLGSVHGSASGSAGQHTIALALRGDDLDLSASAGGSLHFGAALADASWTGTLDTLENRGPWPLRLAAPANVELARRRLRIGEARVAVADGQVQVGDFLWDEGRITSRGGIAAVPAATLARAAGRTLPFASTVTIAGEWSIVAAPRLTGTIALRRESGDLWLASNVVAGAEGAAAGVTVLEVAARFDNDAVDARALFRSQNAGSADANLALAAVAAAPPGRIVPEAPLTLSLHAELPTLQPLQPWVGTSAVVDGRAHLDVAAKGTLRDPQLSGSLVGEALRVDAPRYGLHFVDGRLRAHFAERRLALEELALTAGGGSFRASGSIAAPAQGSRTPQTNLAWRAERFRVFNRPDLNLVVTGEGTVASTNGKLALTGKLGADEGRIVYEPDPTATLGDDVVVKGWPRPAAETRPGADIPFSVDLDLDFGERLRFSGRGLEAGLRGDLHVASSGGGLTGKGSIRTVNGTYFAYGQRLTIDPGRLVFDGPLDNPGLDIIATRKNLAVEAGVVVTGTVKVPIVALTSRPPVPDAEKLSWLVLGHGLDRTAGADFAALQAASAALLGPNSKPVTQTIAERIGLDEISFKSEPAAARGTAQPDAQTQVVAVGKRLSDKLSIVYEQGAAVANNALRLEYSLTQSLTLRANAGAISGFGVYFRRSFE